MARIAYVPIDTAKITGVVGGFDFNPASDSSRDDG
jgi:hypothetical protein